MRLQLGDCPEPGSAHIRAAVVFYQSKQTHKSVLVSWTTFMTQKQYDILVWRTFLVRAPFFLDTNDTW